jgi:hypothetical protein
MQPAFGSAGFKKILIRRAMIQKQAAVPLDTTAFGQQCGSDYSTT